MSKKVNCGKYRFAFFVCICFIVVRRNPQIIFQKSNECETQENTMSTADDQRAQLLNSSKLHYSLNQVKNKSYYNVGEQYFPTEWGKEQ